MNSLIMQNNKIYYTNFISSELFTLGRTIVSGLCLAVKIATKSSSIKGLFTGFTRTAQSK